MSDYAHRCQKVHFKEEAKGYRPYWSFDLAVAVTQWEEAIIIIKKQKSSIPLKTKLVAIIGLQKLCIL